MPARKPFPFQIGSDPEFSLVYQGKRVRCKDVMMTMLRDKVSFGSNLGFKTEKMNGNIGWDGCDSTGELRPNPGKTADEHVENINGIFKELHRLMPAFNLSTLSIQAPVGGHIHLDIPDEFNTQEKIANAFYRLMSFYMPVFFTENQISREIRINGGSYGQLSDFKSGDANTRVRTLEVRAPSAEWLTSPKIATAVLGYMGVVWNEIIHHPKNVAKFKTLLLKNKQQVDGITTIIRSANPLYTAFTLRHIKKAIQTFEFYPEYKEEINYLFNHKKVLEDKNKVGFEIFKGWGLEKPNKKSTKKTFLSQKSIEKRLTEIGLNTEQVTALASPHNNDKNINIFATALEERMSALGWKPKFHYYLFGIKKGVGQPFAGNVNGLVLGAELIKSTQDRTAILKTINRMVGRSAEMSFNATEIDPKRGIVRDERPHIAFGIPWEWRNTQCKVRKFLDLIWSLEKKKNVAFFMPPVVASTEYKEGESPVAKALDAIDAPNLADFTDSTSQGRRIAVNAIAYLRDVNGDTLIPEEVNDQEEGQTQTLRPGECISVDDSEDEPEGSF